MKSMACILVLVVAAVLSGAALAGDEAQEVTLKGNVVCAMCSLQKADAKECQNVLIVAQEGGNAEYYLLKNDVSEKFGHACGGAKAAVVTGAVLKKEDRTWIEPTKIEEPGS